VIADDRREAALGGTTASPAALRSRILAAPAQQRVRLHLSAAQNRPLRRAGALQPRLRGAFQW
jgi:hypothetical protein